MFLKISVAMIITFSVISGVALADPEFPSRSQPKTPLGSAAPSQSSLDYSDSNSRYDNPGIIETIDRSHNDGGDYESKTGQLVIMSGGTKKLVMKNNRVKNTGKIKSIISARVARGKSHICTAQVCI